MMGVEQAMPRIVKLLPRLASDHDGEVIATVAAIRRVLQAENADLHDLCRAMIAPAATKREQNTSKDEPQRSNARDDAAAARWRGRKLPPRWSDLSTEEKVIALAALLDNRACDDWEKGFISDFIGRVREYGAAMRSTAKQEAILDRLVSRAWTMRGLSS